MKVNSTPIMGVLFIPVVRGSLHGNIYGEGASVVW